MYTQQYELLARERQQQLLSDARRRHLRSRLSAEQRWHRLARLARRRERAAALRAAEARDAYTLAG